MQSCAPIEDSDETVQLHSLIRVFDRLSIGPTFFFQEEYLGSDQTARMQLYRYCHTKVPGSSVAECLTRDRRAAGSSLTGVTALCP